MRRPAPGSDDEIEVMRYNHNGIDVVHSDKVRRFGWNFRPGNKVLAKFLDDETKWHPGAVVADFGNGRFSIKYDDGVVASSHRDEMMYQWAAKAFEDDPKGVHR